MTPTREELEELLTRGEKVQSERYTVWDESIFPARMALEISVALLRAMLAASEGKG